MVNKLLWQACIQEQKLEGDDEVFEYRVFTSAKTIPGASHEQMDKTFIVNLDKPITLYLDDEKSYIDIGEGHLIMKHSITYIQNITNGDRKLI